MKLSPSLKQVPATATLLPAQTAQAQTGDGISFLPSDPNALTEMLQLQVLSYKAGNTRARNEIVDIADELRRQKVKKSEQYKTLMFVL